jgi:hypothetical protein
MCDVFGGKINHSTSAAPKDGFLELLFGCDRLFEDQLAISWKGKQPMSAAEEPMD